MNKIKKLLAFCLSVLTVLSLFALVVSAEEAQKEAVLF